MLNKLLNPLRTLKHRFERQIILAKSKKFDSRNKKFLKTLHNKHQGESCVIIGNGPSLKMSDLDLLKKHITFASNKIFLAFDSTNWRPTYYTVVDLIVAKNNIEEIKSLKLTKILSNQTLSIFEDEKAYYFKELMITDKNDKYPFPFSKNALMGINAGHTVIYNQLQLAYFMGFTTVYLIGVDYNFEIPEKTKKDDDYEEVLVNENQVNHFHPDYRKPGETWAKPDLESQFKAFAHAKKVFEDSSRKIYNASRFSKLEVFEKIAFKNIFESV